MFTKLFHFLPILIKSEQCKKSHLQTDMYEGWNFNSGNYLFTTDTK